MMTISRTATWIFGAAALLWPMSVAAQGDTVTSAQGQARGRMTRSDRANLPAPQGFSVVLVLGDMQGTGTAENVPPAARKALTDMKDFLPYKSYRLLDAQWTLCCGRSMIATRLRGLEDQDYDLELDPEPSETSGKWNVRFTLRGTVAVMARGDAAFADRQAAIGAQRAELETKIRTLQERYNENHPEVQQLKNQLKALEQEQVRIRSEESMKRTNRMVATTAGRRAMIDTNFTMDIGETVVVGTSRLQGDKALIALLTAVASTKPSGR